MVIQLSFSSHTVVIHSHTVVIHSHTVVIHGHTVVIHGHTIVQLLYCLLFFTKYELYEFTNKILFTVQKSFQFRVFSSSFIILNTLYLIPLFIV